MVLLADVGGFSGVANTLAAVKVSPSTIENILKILHEQHDGLEGLKNKQFHPVRSASFGAHHSASSLGSHTDKAHAKLSNAILEAVAGLQGSATAVRDFERSMNDADTNAADYNAVLVARTQQAVDTMDDDRSTAPLPSTPDAAGTGEGEQ